MQTHHSWREVPDGIDGSEYERRYALTILGEPIGFTEYAADIASLESVHVIQFFDFDQSSNQ